MAAAPQRPAAGHGLRALVVRQRLLQLSQRRLGRRGLRLLEALMEWWRNSSTTSNHAFAEVATLLKTKSFVHTGEHSMTQADRCATHRRSITLRNTRASGHEHVLREAQQCQHSDHTQSVQGGHPKLSRMPLRLASYLALLLSSQLDKWRLHAR